ncbi:solute carrier family 49 member 4 homolog [Amphiura filiformis]|uniref:solute carrier family 49 member 4 homolog n=1 Tax=Amphiura filiformis TaxID=82378 RepID=UPI003B227BAB
MGISWQDRVSNGEVLQLAKMETVDAILAKSQLRWVGHVVRMPDDRLPKAVMYGELTEGKSKRGGNNLRYRDVVKRHLKTADLDVETWKTEASNRVKLTAHIGQIFIGLGGPICQGGSPALSATWFPANQRTTSTAIATVAGILGSSASFLIGPMIVSDVKSINNTDLFPSHNISNGSIYLTQDECGMALFFCVLIMCYFPAKPPSPPSISASAQREDFIFGAFKLIRHREFWLLGLAYALALGIGQAWMTQIAIIFENTMDVQQDTTGMIAFFASMMGIVGAIFFGGCIDILGGKMKTVLLLIQTAGLALFIWYILLATGFINFHLAMLYVCIICLFFFMNGAIPVYYEITVEASYPIAEGIITLTITWLMNVFGLVFLCVFMVPDIGASWMNYVMLGAVFSSLPLLILHRENYAFLMIAASPDLHK